MIQTTIFAICFLLACGQRAQAQERQQQFKTSSQVASISILSIRGTNANFHFEDGLASEAVLDGNVEIRFHATVRELNSGKESAIAGSTIELKRFPAEEVRRIRSLPVAEANCKILTMMLKAMKVDIRDTRPKRNTASR